MMSLPLYFGMTDQDADDVIAENFGERMKQDVQTPDKPERDAKIDM